MNLNYMYPLVEETIAKYLMNEKDNYIAFKDLYYHSCSKCEYECLKEKCKYRSDDIYNLLDSFYKKNFIEEVE